MTTLNTEKTDDGYRYDPFAEYHHPQEAGQSEQVFESEPVQQPQVSLQEGKEQLLKNIDDVFDGANFVFDIADKFFKRLGGR